MLPSAVAAQAGAYWDVVASSTLLGLPAPGFGSLGKSFLIENLLRAGAGPTHAPPPPRPAPGPECPQLRSLPASPVPLKLCPAGPYGGARWAFQMPPGRVPGERDSAFQPSAPGELWPRGTPAQGSLNSGETQASGTSILGNLSLGEPQSRDSQSWESPVAAAPSIVATCEPRTAPGWSTAAGKSGVRMPFVDI